MVGSALPVHAWWPKGHSLVAQSAVLALPPATANTSAAANNAGEAMPDFFRAGWATIAHCAQDPDVFKNRDLPNLTDREAPEHYLDYEMLGDLKLPAKRSDYMALCLKNNIDPEDAGTLPYAVIESTERLAVAFAEYRKWPDNPHIRMKCLIYAGLLSHYTGDLEMPLHVTIHHDGRAQANGKSPRSGIHARLDSLIEKLAQKRLLSAASLASKQQVAPLTGDLLPAVLQEIARSRENVDRAYELESSLPPADEKAVWNPDGRVVEFGVSRGRAATNFTASLFLTAWRRSTELKLPVWLEREAGP